MEKISKKEVMKAAHRFYRSRFRSGQSWQKVLEMSWFWEKNRRRMLEERGRLAREKFRNYNPAHGADYNDITIPLSAFYNPHSKGHLGAHYVGD